MADVCARCEAVLPLVDAEPPAFCWQCGLPQLRVAESVWDAAEARQNAAAAQGSAATAVPVDANAVDWPRMLRILLGATVVGLLPCLVLRDVLLSGAAGMPVLFLLPVLCLASGYVYLRQWPARRMSASGGAQMGLALGTMLAVAVTVVTAVAGFWLRYFRHNRSLQATFDGVMQQAEAQVRATQPDAPEHMVTSLRLPEWHAGWFLLMQGGLVVLLMLCGCVAGLVAGALLRARQDAMRAGSL